MKVADLGNEIAHGRMAQIYALDERRVLKLFRVGNGHDTAEYEFTVARAVTATGMSAPQALDLIEVDGRPGIVYERLRGESMLKRLIARPWQAKRLAQQMADVHALVHKHSAVGAGLPDQRARLLRHLCRIDVLTTFEKARVTKMIEALPSGDVLCHGDFHPDNILLTADGPRVIDWNNATSGNPNGDAAWTLAILRYSTPDKVAWPLRVILGAVQQTFCDAYFSRYLNAAYAWKRDIDAWRLPCAAVRLADGIAAERETLLHVVRGGMAELKSAKA